MTFKFMRPALAIALALGLAACGGKASYTVGGTVTGLSYSGLTLSTNGMVIAIDPGAKTYSFPNSLSYGDTYEVLVQTQPAHQSCSVGLNNKDSAGHQATIAIPVTCSLNAKTIGGKITGLTSSGLVLINGSTGGSVSPLATDTTFTFTNNPVAYGVTYNVTVKNQPDNDVCTVTGGNGSGDGTSNPNGSGTMLDTAVTDLLVTCSPKP